MAKRLKLLIFLLVVSAPLVWGLWFAEQWVWNTLPEAYRWMFLWVQVVLGGVGIGYLCYHQVILRAIERRHQKQLQSEIQAYQETYDSSREKTCLYATAAGSVSRLLWSDIQKFEKPLLSQSLKICCLVPDDAIDNAETSVRQCLRRFGGLNPSPILIKPVSSGKLQQAGADAARKAERPEIKKVFTTWSSEALSKVKMVHQFVGISHGNTERPGYTARSCFENYPFVGLRKELGDKITGEIPRWVTVVLDMEEQITNKDKSGDKPPETTPEKQGISNLDDFDIEVNDENDLDKEFDNDQEEIRAVN